MIVCVNPAQYELVVKRSQFIARSRYIESRADVKPIIDELRAEHVGARHVCYGYIADEKGDDFGYDDDGEPSGTAGKPIYSALAAVGARKTLISVVRYFGGIKLGAGGLTRAYRQSASELIAAAGLVSAEKRAAYAVRCDGEVYKKAVAVLRGIGCTIENIVYDDAVRFTALAPAEKDVAGALSPLKISPVKIDERYVLDGERA